MPSDRHILNSLYKTIIQEEDNFNTRLLLTEVKMSESNTNKLIKKYARKVFKYSLEENSHLVQNPDLAQKYEQIKKYYNVYKRDLKKAQYDLEDGYTSETPAKEAAFAAAEKYIKIIKEIEEERIIVKDNFFEYLDNIILAAAAPRSLRLNAVIPPAASSTRPKQYTVQETKLYRDLMQFLINNEINITALVRDVYTSSSRRIHPHIPKDILNYYSNNNLQLGDILKKADLRTSSTITNEYKEDLSRWLYWLSSVTERRTPPTQYTGSAITKFLNELPKIEPLNLSQSVINSLRDRNIEPSKVANSSQLYTEYWKTIFTSANVRATNDTYELLRQILIKAAALGLRQDYPIAYEYAATDKVDSDVTGKWMMLDPDADTIKINDRQIIFYLVDFERYIIPIIYLFNKKQASMPIKDIFGYPTLNDLLRALLLSQSQRSIKKRYKTALIPEELKKSIIFENERVLVVQPNSWEVSRKYFGPTRPSFINFGMMTRGGSWCTSASNDDKFREYTIINKQNLYYFVDLKDDSLWAIMTGGRSRARIDDLAGELHMNMKNNPEIEELKKKFSFASIMDYRGFFFLHVYKYFSFEEFAHKSTIEARNQENTLIDPIVIYNRFNLDADWRKNYIKYIDAVDNKKFTK